MSARRLLAPLALGLLCAGVAGCGTVKFYAQAIDGQAEILRKARPVPVVMRDQRVPREVKRKLAVVQDARRFALQLGLPANRQYDRYTDLNRRCVSWVVYAAPEFSVEGKTWWYPLVGRLEYRGFFSKAAAESEAADLRAQGFETYIGGVEAYSTLGWFRDPVLNTFFRRSDPELAELIFHELTHVKLFLPGDTDFNEAFATANAEACVRRWLESNGDHRALRQYEAGLTRDREIVRLLLKTRDRLGRLYRDKARSVAQMRREKAAIFARMRQESAQLRARWPGDSRYDRTFSKPWNNARLNTVATYYELVPGFEGLLRKQRGDLKSFHLAVEKMRPMTKDERRSALRAAATSQ